MATGADCTDPPRPILRNSHSSRRRGLPTSALVLTLAAALPGCLFGTDTDEPQPETDPAPVQFRMEPSVAALYPGECSYHALAWSGERLLDPSEVEFEFPTGISGSYLVQTGVGYLLLCAGDVNGDGDVRARLTGQTEFVVVGPAYNNKPEPRDADPREATWTRGTSMEPSRVFWSADGTEVYVPSGDMDLLDVYDGFTGLRLDTHLTHGETAALIDEDRVIVDLPERATIYNLAERSYETWFNSIHFQPGHDFTQVPESIWAGTGFSTSVAASNGTILTIGYGLNQCQNALTVLEPFSRIEIASNSADGFATGMEIDAGHPDRRWSENGLERPAIGRWAELSESGRFAHYGPKSCTLDGASLVDFETHQVYRACIPSARALYGHGPVLSRDESVLVGYNDGGATLMIDAVSTDGCAPISSLRLPWDENPGFAVSPDGQTLAIAYSEPSPPQGIFYKAIDIRLYDLADPSAQFAEWSIDAHFVAGDQHLRPHRLAYSPDGTRIAVVDAKGRFYLVDANDGEVTAAEPFDWASARLTPDPHYVLVKREDPFPRNWMLVDPFTQEVLREHEEDIQLFTAAFEDGYVMYHPGALTYTFYTYDPTDPGVPFDGDLADAFDPDLRASDSGESTCSFSDDGTVCIDDACADSATLRPAAPALPTDCVVVRDGWALFQHAGSLYSWNGISDQYAHFSSLPGLQPTAMKNLMRLSDGQIVYQNRSHLLYWSL